MGPGTNVYETSFGQDSASVVSKFYEVYLPIVLGNSFDAAVRRSFAPYELRSISLRPIPVVK